MGFLKPFIAITIACMVYYLFSGTEVDRSVLLANISGRNVLITGASSGIGEQLAYQYAIYGANIFLTARREKLLQKVVSKCRSLAPSNTTHTFVAADMTDPDQSQHIVQKAVHSLGHLDVLVLNHVYNEDFGYWQGNRENITSLRKALEGSFTSFVVLASEALPILEEVNGSVAVISSAAGHIPIPTWAPYVAAKHAVEGFFRTLRSELRNRHINVSISIFPLGPTDTYTLDKGEAALCTKVGYPLCCFDLVLGQRVTAMEAAEEITTSTTLRRYDIWFPSRHMLWATKLFQHLWPRKMEDIETLFPKI